MPLNIAIEKIVDALKLELDAQTARELEAQPGSPAAAERRKSIGSLFNKQWSFSKKVNSYKETSTMDRDSLLKLIATFLSDLIPTANEIFSVVKRKEREEESYNERKAQIPDKRTREANVANWRAAYRQAMLDAEDEGEDSDQMLEAAIDAWFYAMQADISINEIDEDMQYDMKRDMNIFEQNYIDGYYDEPKKDWHVATLFEMQEMAEKIKETNIQELCRELSTECMHYDNLRIAYNIFNTMFACLKSNILLHDLREQDSDEANEKPHPIYIYEAIKPVLVSDRTATAANIQFCRKFTSLVKLLDQMYGVGFMSVQRKYFLGLSKEFMPQYKAILIRDAELNRPPSLAIPRKSIVSSSNSGTSGGSLTPSTPRTPHILGAANIGKPGNMLSTPPSTPKTPQIPATPHNTPGFSMTPPIIGAKATTLTYGTLSSGTSTSGSLSSSSPLIGIGTPKHKSSRSITPTFGALLPETATNATSKSENTTTSGTPKLGAFKPLPN